MLSSLLAKISPSFLKMKALVSSGLMFLNSSKTVCSGVKTTSATFCCHPPRLSYFEENSLGDALVLQHEILKTLGVSELIQPFQSFTNLLQNQQSLLIATHDCFYGR